MQLGPGQQGRAFVDLVKRIGRDHQRIIGAIHHGLGESKQRLAGAVDRQHVVFGIQAVGRQRKALAEPIADRLAQFERALGQRVFAQAVDVFAHAIGDEGRCGMLWLADRQRDVRQLRGLGIGKQGPQFLERVGLQFFQVLVHLFGRAARKGAKLYMNARENGPMPVAALLYAATFWGFVWYPARLLEQQGMVGTWQALLSYASALLVLLLLRGVRLRGLSSQPWDVLWLVLASGWTNVAFLLAVIADDVVRVLILFYLSPLWTVLLGRWLLGELIRPVTAAMLLLGLGGALVMLWHEQMLSQPLGSGDLLALSSGLAFALTNVMTRRLGHLGTVVKTQLAWLGVVLVAGLWIVLAGVPLPDATATAWGGAVALGLLGFMFSTLCVVYAVSRMPVQRSSIIMLFEIVVGALSAWLLVGETVSLREWIGGGMIVSAGLVAVLYGSAKPLPQRENNV